MSTNAKPTERFTDRAEVYAANRPSYGADVIAYVLDGLGEHPVVADLGAGTGISSRRMAEHGARVLAVEPNAAMRSAGAGDVRWVDGTAEKTHARRRLGRRGDRVPGLPLVRGRTRARRDPPHRAPRWQRLPGAERARRARRLRRCLRRHRAPLRPGRDRAATHRQRGGVREAAWPVREPPLRQRAAPRPRRLDRTNAELLVPSRAKDRTPGGSSPRCATSSLARPRTAPFALALTTLVVRVRLDG